MVRHISIDLVRYLKSLWQYTAAYRSLKRESSAKLHKSTDDGGAVWVAEQSLPTIIDPSIPTILILYVWGTYSWFATPLVVQIVHMLLLLSFSSQIQWSRDCLFCFNGTAQYEQCWIYSLYDVLLTFFGILLFLFNLIWCKMNTTCEHSYHTSKLKKHHICTLFVFDFGGTNKMFIIEYYSFRTLHQ